jgi:hypothetical protein
MARLRNMQRFGGVGEIAIYGDGQQVTEMAQQQGRNYLRWLSIRL